MEGVEKFVDLRRRQNELSSIYRLPNETLSYIFEITAKRVQRKLRFSLRDLSRVSHRWRRIVLVSPRLWSTIVIDKDLWNHTLLEAFIRNSRQAPLEIALTEENNLKHPDFSVFMPLVAAHTHRWRRFKLHCFPVRS